MEGGSDFERWRDLIPDALGLIFSKLSFKVKLTVIPLVCKSWRKAVMGPYCWRDIDIKVWSSHRPPAHVDRMVQMLIKRRGSIRKLAVCCLHSPAGFSFIAENAGGLQTLRLIKCNLTDSITEQLGPKLSTITYLDLSYCNKITDKTLEIIGNNCKLLVKLCRNMHPLDIAKKYVKADAIAATMPKLKHLEMTYNFLQTVTVINILSNCSDLEYFDLKGCWDVKLEKEHLKQNFPKVKIWGPRYSDKYETKESDECSDFSDDCDNLSGKFLTSEMMDFYLHYKYAGFSFGTMGDDEIDLSFYGGMYRD